MRRLALLLLLLTAACAERWERPGTSEVEADAMNAACTQESQLVVPPQMVWQMIEPPRFYTDRDCWEERGQRRCVTRQRFVPARYGHVDVAAPARDGWRRQCMEGKGFRFSGYRPLRLE